MTKHATKTGVSDIKNRFKKALLLTLFSVGLFFVASVGDASAAVKYWIGPGGGNFTSNSNWSTASGGANDTIAPTASDIATFDSGGNTNCTIDSAINVAGIDIKATYTLGTISQGGNTITVGTSHFTQAGGTFTGGTVAIDITGSFIISGGTFTSTSGVMTISQSFTKTGTPTFNANGGTVTFGGAYIGSSSIDASGITFNLVTINRNADLGHISPTLTIVSGTTIPLGDSPTVTLNNIHNYGYFLTNNGIITTGTGTATFNIDGTLTNTGSISGNATTLAFNGNLTNSGTVTFASATPAVSFSVYGDSGYGTVINNGTLTFSSASTITIAGGFTNSALKTITTAANPTFNVGGGFEISSTSTFPANITLNLNGTTYTGNSTIDAPSVTYASAVTINRTINSGTTYPVLTIASGTTIPLGDSPTVTLNNINSGQTYSLTNNGIITFGTGTATFNIDTAFINNGTISGNATTLALNCNFTNNTTTTLSSVTTVTSVAFGDAAGNLINNSTLNLNNVTSFTVAGGLTNVTGSTITTAANPTFNVGGGFEISSTSTFPANITLNLNGTTYTGNSTIDAPSVTYASAVTINRNIGSVHANPVLTIASGTTIPLGDAPTVTLYNTHGGSYLYYLINNGVITIGTGTAAFNINGTFTNNGTITTGETARANSLGGTYINGTNSTVIYTGDGDSSADTRTISGANTFASTTGNAYYNLTLNATDGTMDVFQAGGAMTIGNNLTITAGTFDPNTYLMTGSGTNTLSITGGIKNDTATFAENYTSFETITYNAVCTYEYSGAGSQTVGLPLSCNNLTISGAGTKTLSGATSVVGNLLINAGTLVQGNNTLSAATITQNGGTFTGDSTVDTPADIAVTGNVALSSGTFTSTKGSLLVGGNYSQSYSSFTHNSGTVNFNSGSAQTIAATGTLNNVIHSGAGTLTIDTISLLAGTGGTITYDGAYTVHTFTSSGSFVASSGGVAEVLVVAGGGGGGSATGNGGGGGGAGGLVYNSSFYISDQTHGVSVGNGGNGGSGAAGSDGQNSIFSSITAIGGGGGGTYQGAGRTGGSGGGRGRDSTTTPQTNGTDGQGYAGGAAGSSVWGSGGGGGGAGGVGYQGGADNTTQTGTLGNGGPGLAYSISGVSQYYAAGGGGAWYTGTVHSQGGSGIGGNGGGASGPVVTSGAVNTGSGGGGGVSVAGAGGSGIVIIRYLTPTSSISTLTIAGNLTNSAGTIDANGQNITLAGNWINNSTFTPGTGTVTFNGVDQSVTGTTTFYNLTKQDDTNDGTDRTLTFKNGQTFTVSNLLTLIGTDSDDRVKLVSDSPGSQWNLNANGTFDIHFVNVHDSNASGGLEIQHADTTQTPAPGNNLNWGFDTTPPSINSVTTTTSSGSYTVGEVIALTVTFSESATSTGSVTVTTNTSRTCTFSISNNTTASCNYTVQAGDNTSALSITDVAGTIADQMGNVMTDFTIATNITPSKTIVIDTTAPTINSVTTTTNSGNYKQGEVIPLTVNFSEAVTSTGDITVNTNTSRSCVFTISNNTSGSCNYTVQAGDNTSALTVSSISGTITDQMSIAMSSFTIGTNLTPGKTIVIDTTAPTIDSVTSTTVSGYYKAGEVITLTVSFFEAVTSAEVTVNTNTGRSCTFSITNSTSGSCNYTVQAGDTTFALSATSISGTINDQAGNTMTSYTIGTNLDSGKTIVIDTTAPAVSTLSPLDGASGVTLNQNLIITFNDIINKGTGNITIKKTSDETTVETIDVTTAQVTGAGTSIITINPSITFDSFTGYYIQIANTAFTDRAGNSYAGINNTTDWNFVSLDTELPTISSVTSTTVSGRYKQGEVIPLTVIFSEAVTSAEVTVNTNTSRSCTFSITNNTTGSCNYTVQAGDTTSALSVSSISGTINDQSSNTLTNFTIPTNLTPSKTIIIDTTAPTVTTLSPLDNSTGISTSQNLVLAFTEIVNKGTGNIAIKKSSDNTTVETIAVTDSKVTGEGTTTITINPDTVLDSLTEFYVQIDSTAFVDRALNQYAGISNNSDWNFTTGDFVNPTVLSVTTSRGAGSYKAGVTIPLTVTFSKEVTSTGLVTVNTNTSRSCTFEITNATSGSCTYTVESGDSTNLFSISSVTGTIKDASDNLLTDSSPITNINPSKTIIIDTTAPTITSVTTSTTSGSYAIGEVIPLTITFSEAVTSTGDITLNTSVGQSCTLTITNNTTGSCDYTVQVGDTTSALDITSITGTIKDQALNSLTNYNIGTNLSPTKTIQIDGIRPTATSVTTTTLEGRYKVGEIIPLTITFSEPVTSTGNVTVNINTAQSCTFSLTNSTSGSCSYTVQAVDNTSALSISSIAGVVEDQTGNSLTVFSVGTNLTPAKTIIIDTIAPTVSTLSPPNNGIGVHETADFIITFTEPVLVGSGNITLKRATDDTTLETIAVTDTKVTGVGTTTITIAKATVLAGNEIYYLLIDSTAFVDRAGNSYAGISNNDVWHFTSRSQNEVPVVSSISDIKEATDGTNHVSFKVKVSDADRQKTSLKLEYSKNNKDWYKVTVKRVDSADVNNDNLRQLSSIATDEGEKEFSVTWDAFKDLEDTELANVYLRITPYDGINEGEAKVSDSFKYDGRSPQITGFKVTTIKDNQVSFIWITPVDEANFREYEICLGLSLGNTKKCNDSWNSVSDKNLLVEDTKETTVTDLLSDTDYYFMLKASDMYGNEKTLELTKKTTLETPIITPTPTATPVTTEEGGGDNNGGDGGGDDGKETQPVSTPRSIDNPPVPQPEEIIIEQPKETPFPVVSNIVRKLNPFYYASTLELYTNAFKSTFRFARESGGVEKVDYGILIIGAISVLGSISLISTMINVIGDLPYLLQWLFNLLLGITSVGKKRKPWGKVIDQFSGLPVEGVLVLIIDAQTGKVKEQSYTDKDGAFSSFLPQGNYLFRIAKRGWQLSLEKPNYRISKQEVQFNGAPLVVNKEGVIPIVLIIKPEEKTPNLFVQMILRILHLAESILDKISWPVLIAGFAFNSLIYFTTHEHFALYVGFFYIGIASLKCLVAIRHRRTYGLVSNRKTKEVLGLAIIRIYDSANGKIIDTKVANAEGKFFLLLKPGKYNFTIQKEGYVAYQATDLVVRRESRALALRAEMEPVL